MIQETHGIFLLAASKVVVSRVPEEFLCLFAESLSELFEIDGELTGHIRKARKVSDTAEKKGISRSLWMCETNEFGNFYLKNYHSAENALREFELLNLAKNLVVSEKIRVEPQRPASLHDCTLITKEAIGVPVREFIFDAKKIRSYEDVIQVCRAAGEWLRKFHYSEFAQVGAIDVVSNSTVVKDIAHKVLDSNLNSYSDDFLSDKLIKDIRSKVLNQLDASKENLQISLCHGDYCFQNLLFEKSKGVVTVLDFENWCHDLQLLDVAFFMSKLEHTMLIHPATRSTLSIASEKFIESYAAGGEPIDKRLINAFVILQLLRFRRPLEMKGVFKIWTNIKTLLRRRAFVRLLKLKLASL
jgi:hypothetical protein